MDPRWRPPCAPATSWPRFTSSLCAALRLAATSCATRSTPAPMTSCAIPFEPEVLAARVAAGLRAARLRANEALLRSLVANIPGALYRCECDEHWTMQWLSDEIEEISGYPASDFIGSAVRTFMSVVHPDDREQVQRAGQGCRRGAPAVHVGIPDPAA